MNTVMQSFVFFPTDPSKNPLAINQAGSRGYNITDTALLEIERDGVVDLFSYFNSLSIEKWRRYTTSADIFLTLVGHGVMQVSFYETSKDHGKILISSQDISINNEKVTFAVVPSSEAVLISVLIISKGRSTVSSMSWETNSKPERTVKVAAVVTCFNRPLEVREMIARIRKDWLGELAPENFEMLIVNNGDNIEVESCDRVTVVSNKNLGGAGGFTRGLIESQNRDVTHVLFMDDDASCELESVKRTINFLKLSKDQTTCMAGAFLYSHNSCVQFEKGALFSRDGRGWSSNGHLLDLSKASSVLISEEDKQNNYGGWWYFCFPIKEAKKLPFPYFVRGDDVDFALANCMNIVTLNGVATWSEDFGFKNGPVVEYLAMRSWIALTLTYCRGFIAMLRFYKIILRAVSLSMALGNYDAIWAISAALRDVAKGPVFFAKNPAPFQRLKKVSVRRNIVKSANHLLRKEVLPIVRWYDHILVYLTVFGLLVPNFLRLEMDTFSFPHWTYSFKNAYKLKWIRMVNAEGQIFVYKSFTLGLRSFLIFAYSTIIFFIKYPFVVDDFRNGSDKYRSEAYWKRELELMDT